MDGPPPPDNGSPAQARMPVIDRVPPISAAPVVLPAGDSPRADDARADPPRDSGTRARGRATVSGAIPTGAATPVNNRFATPDNRPPDNELPGVDQRSPVTTRHQNSGTRAQGRATVNETPAGNAPDRSLPAGDHRSPQDSPLPDGGGGTSAADTIDHGRPVPETRPRAETRPADERTQENRPSLHHNGTTTPAYDDGPSGDPWPTRPSGIPPTNGPGFGAPSARPGDERASRRVVIGSLVAMLLIVGGAFAAVEVAVKQNVCEAVHQTTSEANTPETVATARLRKQGGYLVFHRGLRGAAIAVADNVDRIRKLEDSEQPDVQPEIATRTAEIDRQLRRAQAACGQPITGIGGLRTS